MGWGGYEWGRRALAEVTASRTAASLEKSGLCVRRWLRCWRSASENVFDTTAVPSLSPQAKQPLLVTMDCLNGYFIIPYFNSPAEELLKARDKGAIAAFSPPNFSL